MTAREKEAADVQNLKDTVAQLTGEQESKEVEYDELMRKVTDLKRTLKEKRQGIFSYLILWTPIQNSLNYFEIIAFEKYKVAKAAQLEKNGPELACFQDRLALVIKNLDGNCGFIESTILEKKLSLVNTIANVVQFVFTHIDEKNWSREYSFVIDVSVPKVYKCKSCLRVLFIPN
jgi:hypothetical protein